MALVGHNIKLTKDEVEAAILERALLVAKSKGLPLLDSAEFAKRAKVHFQFSDGDLKATLESLRKTDLDSVDVIWSD